MRRASISVFRVAEFRGRLAYTLALLAVYRLGVSITTAGVDRVAMSAYIQEQEVRGGLVNLFNLFSGGALDQMSILGLGTMPYVLAFILMQLLTAVVPTLKRLRKEGAAGRQTLNQYTRYGSILLSAVMGIGIARWLASLGRHPIPGSSDPVVVPNDSVWFTFMTVITLTAGTAFIMWLGERITERGIGNGISLILFAGIVARLPSTIGRLVELPHDKAWFIPVLAVFTLLVVGVMVYIEKGMRRVPVQYAKRMGGRTIFAGPTYFPIKVNASGVIPPILAGAILGFPATLGNWLPGLAKLQRALESRPWLYDGVFVLLIIFFTYFYTTLTFRADDVADNIKKHGGYIPGVRPGRQTAESLSGVLNRITFGGAIYLALICVIPSILSNPVLSFQFGGMALLVVVSIALDTFQRIEAILISGKFNGRPPPPSSPPPAAALAG